MRGEHMDLFSVKSIRTLLSRHGFHFSKAMGQNFLVDEMVPEAIVDGAGIDESFGVLEVGPGIGALTGALARTAGAVTAVELDHRLLPVLDETLVGYDNVTIVQGDILKLNIAEIVREMMPDRRYAACANLPYNITTPAVTALIEAGVFESITVMVQREVALRMAAAPGTADYGAFSVFTRYYTEPKILFDVPPESFVPAPKVTSSVIRLVPRATKPASGSLEKMFFRLTRASFAQRRKTLVNGLESAFGGMLKKDALRELITGCGFDEKIRGEALGIPEFLSLARAVQARLGLDQSGGAT